ncbi:MAG TPA: LPXTG cell wall anchor domain-containing protein [Thermoanaerobaculia bacterium]
MKRILVVAMLAVATIALGQNADKNTAGPTKNDYRLRVIEPAEGATITGPTVRIVVNTEIPQQVGSNEKPSTDTMPRPDVKVFLDNEQKGVLKDQTNVLTLDSVPPGSHKIVVVATNRSGEIIDRKEVSFSSTAAATASTETTSTSAASSYGSQPSSAPAPSTKPQPIVRETKPVPPPAPAETLPKTASSFPLIAAAGLTLLALGLAIRRRG